FQYLLNAWANNRICGGLMIDMVDEVNSRWMLPLQGVGTGGVLVGTNGLSSVVCGNGTCTVHWTGWGLNGSGHFIITGSGTSLDYNPAIGTPAPYSSARVDGNTFTFAAAGTFNITSGTLQVEPFVDFTYKADLSGACPYDGVTPCPKYIRYDAFKQLRDWQLA